MVSTVQNYSLNNQTVAVDLLDSAPDALSPLTRGIFRNMGAQTPPSLQMADSDLREKIDTLENLGQMLQRAQNTSTERKVVAFLFTALNVALIAGTVLACVFGGPFGFALGLPAGLALLGIVNMFSASYFGSKIAEIDGQSPGAEKVYGFLPGERIYEPSFTSLALGMTGILPLYEAFTREKRCEDVMHEVAGSVQKDLNALEKRNNQRLPKALEYYANNAETLKEGLEARINELEEQLSIVKQTKDLIFEEHSLQNRISNNRAALAELERVGEFYIQFLAADADAAEAVADE